MIDAKKIIDEALEGAHLDWEKVLRLQSAIDQAGRDMRRRAAGLYVAGALPSLDDFGARDDLERQLLEQAKKGHWLEVIVLGVALLDMNRRIAEIRALTFYDPHLPLPEVDDE
jgi:hypothetical protein